MSPFEQIQAAREKLEAAIRDASQAAIRDFERSTGATLDGLSIELVSYWPLGMAPECKVGRVKATVNL